MSLSIADIRHLFDQFGARAYSGEPVTQLQHALQAATLAQDSGAQGYVLKSEPFDVLTRAIETVGGSDRFFVSPHLFSQKTGSL